MAATIPTYTVVKRIVNATTGADLSGAVVELKRGAVVVTMSELGTSAVYKATSVASGRYAIWVNAEDTLQSTDVGSGEVAATGTEAGVILIGTATGWEHSAPGALWNFVVKDGSAGAQTVLAPVEFPDGLYDVNQVQAKGVGDDDSGNAALFLNRNDGSRGAFGLIAYDADENQYGAAIVSDASTNLFHDKYVAVTADDTGLDIHRSADAVDSTLSTAVADDKYSRISWRGDGTAQKIVLDLLDTSGANPYQSAVTLNQGLLSLLCADGLTDISGATFQDGKVLLSSLIGAASNQLLIDAQGVKPTAQAGISASTVLSLDANGAIQSGALTAAAIGAMTNPMDSIGDMIVGGASGAPAKLDAGAAGYFLQAAGAASPAWFDLFGTANTWTAAQSINSGTTAVAFGLTSNSTSVTRFNVTNTTASAGAGTTWGFMAHGSASSLVANYGQGAFSFYNDQLGQHAVVIRRDTGAFHARFGFQSEGNTVIGSEAADTLTVFPSAVTWATGGTAHSGNHTWSGSMTMNGAVTLGDAAGDNIIVNGSISSNLVPTGSRNLGSSTAQWSAIFANAFSTTRAVATNTILEAIVTGDTNYRFSAYANGTLNWGPGNAGFDVSLSRISANLLGLAAGDNLQIGGLSGTGTRMVVADANGLLSTQTVSASICCTQTFPIASTDNASAMSSGVLYYTTFIPEAAQTVANVQIHCTSFTGTKSVIVGVYNKATGAQVATGTISVTAAGLFSGSLSASLAGGTEYRLALGEGATSSGNNYVQHNCINDTDIGAAETSSTLPATVGTLSASGVSFWARLY